jgi:hypothetical protein
MKNKSLYQLFEERVAILEARSERTPEVEKMIKSTKEKMKHFKPF